MTKFYSFQVEAVGVKDPRRLLDYHRKAQPPWTVVLDGVGLGRDIKAASPATNIIIRQYKSDGFWYQHSPQDYLDFMDKACGDFDCWSFVDNEAGINPDWNIRLIQASVMRKIPRKLVIGNLSVGTPPKPEEWSYAKTLDLLRLCDQYREWVVYGLHEYFAAVVTSGFIGGWPDNAGVQPDSNARPGEKGSNLIPPSHWPPKAVQLTRFHMGRFQFLVNACKDAGIKPPRIVLTETGADDVSDIKGFLNKLKVAPGYLNIRGYKTLFPQWREWWPQWSEDQAYAENLIYAAENIYADSPVEGGCIYCYSNDGNPEWEQFNLEGREEFLTRLEQYAAYAAKPTIPPPPIIEVKPVPAVLDILKPISKSFGLHYRARNVLTLCNEPAGVKLPDAILHPGDEFTMYEIPAQLGPDGAYWKWVESAGVLKGWLISNGLGYEKLVTKPPATEAPTITSEVPVVKVEPARRLFYQVVKIPLYLTQEEADSLKDQLELVSA